MATKTTKNTKKKATGKSKTNTRNSSGASSEKILAFLKGDDFARMRGVFYMLLAVFLLVAMISYFFSLSEPGNNWLGSLGNGAATLLIEQTFGLGALGFSIILCSLSLYVFRHARKNKRYNEGLAPEIKHKVVLPIGSTTFYCLFWMAWLSCTLGYIDVAFGDEDFQHNFECFAGVFGYSIAAGLNGLISIFTPILLLALAAIMVFYVHHVQVPKIKLPEWKKKERGEDMELVEEEDEEEEDEEVEEEDEDVDRRPWWKRILHPRVDDEEDDGGEFVNDYEQEVPRKEPKQEPVETIEPGVPVSLMTETEEKVETPQQESDIAFDIDDEFERIMRRATGKTSETSNTDEPEFTITGMEEPENKGAEVGFEVKDTGMLENDDIDVEVVSVPDEKPRVVVEDGQLVNAETGEELPPYDPHLDLKDYQMPSLDILRDWEEKNVRVTKEELIENKDRIVKTLRDYGIEIVGISASPGPTVTLYEIKPAPGVRISKIKSLEDDIALSLAALGIRIIAPIPGKSAVGIEVPNAKPQIVSMKTMLSSDQFVNSGKMELPIALGKTISNEPYVTDLAKMPHLLMAGATGTGKSVGLNAIIASLLYKKHPSELKFVMVDPKKVELSLYSKIERHYLAKMPDETDAIITDVKKVVRTLNSLCIEMDQRYDLLKQAGVRKITEYNDKFKKRRLNPQNGHRYLPYIVLVIDEFADLIMTAGKEVELPICRLAQLARAVGIHLIIATQRPTTNIITGTIKTNFPARIAFRVTSAIDSRTILDTGGANQLIGRGDMLISLAGSDMVRIQCALIETEEIDQLADQIGMQRGYPDGFILPEYLDENEAPNKDFDPRQKDAMFEECARLVVASQFGSTSLLQRKLQLGYNRAGRIMDQLEAAGIVGPYNGSKAREVLVKDEVSLQDILRSL